MTSKNAADGDGHDTMTFRLLQQRDTHGKRSVIAARGDRAAIVPDVASVRELATAAITAGHDLATAAAARGSGPEVDIVAANAAGQLLPPIDHDDNAHVLLTGTGLTHLGSAEGRDKMHSVAATAQTDSMRMFLAGLEGGKLADGEVGQQPEWFYKGDGSQLVGTGAALTVPDFAQDGSEEPELAGIYLIGPDGTPFRLGICLANEFSDHVTERYNYLLLAHSKLRQAALGPELLVGTLPAHVEGSSRIRRGNAVLWEKSLLSGEANKSHSIDNLERHHFKYAQFRKPGDIHVHFFGTATLSFSDGICTEPGDIFEIEAAPFVLPLREPLVRAAADCFAVRSL